MHPAHSHQPPTSGLIEVRHKASVSVMFIVSGSILLGLGLLSLFFELFSLWVILGPLFLVTGIVSRSKPYLRFDLGQGAMHMYGPLGNRVRTYGAPKGERIAFDGANVVRLRADGGRKKIRTSSGEPADVQRLQQALWSLQQSQGPA